MEYIRVTKDNLEKEHICCAISNNKDIQVSSKKAWLADRFDDGLVFLKSTERGKCFIEYIPAENAWNPIDADGYMFIDCLWVSGSFKGHGYSNDLLGACVADSRERGKKGLCTLCAEKKKPFLADPKFLKYKGFAVCDEADNGIQLWYLPFSFDAEPPRFKDCARHPHVEEKGYVLYYTSQCPFNAKYVPIVEQTAKELINKFEGESQETTGVNDSYIEIRDLGKRGKMGRFDIYVHHADGTESNVRFGTDRRKFCYLLLLLLISNKDSVQGLMARFFCYGRERLVSLARISLLADEEGPEKWIEKFIYDNEYDKENKQWHYTYTNWMYSNELRKASDYFKEVCSDEELELYKTRSTGGRDSITSIAVSPEQIVIPDSLALYTKGLPTRDFMLKYKSVSRRSQNFSMAKKLNPNKYEEWDEETGPIDLLSE